jgi:O-antigen/teichoic acid export membrane protein
MERAVSRSLLLRAWNFFPGVIVATLVPSFLSSAEQGFYYAFASLIAIQVFFELGLAQVLVVKFAGLYQQSSEALNASTERLGLLLFASRVCYRLIGFSFFVIVLLAGFMFFSSHSVGEINWKAPWFVLVLATSINLIQSVKLSYLEAVGHLHHVAIARLRASLLSSFLFILVIVFGGRLWSACVQPIVNAFFLTLWIYTHKHSLLYRQERGASVSSNRIIWRLWLSDVFPMQWKISISWISGYLIYQLYTPFVFARYGSVEAGKLGYVISIMSSLMVVGTTFVSALSPTLASLFASKRYTELVSVFERSFCLSISALVVLLFSVPLILFCLPLVSDIFAARFLSVPEALAFAFNYLFAGATFALSIYLRAQQDDPLVVPTLVTAIVTLLCILIAIQHSIVAMLWSASLAGLALLVWTFCIYLANRARLQNLALSA